VASAVLAYRDEEIDPGSWASLEIEYFQRQEGEDWHPEEDPEDVLASLLAFAHNPVVTSEHPVDRRGLTVPSSALVRKIRRGDDWRDGITFPTSPCECRTLLLTDMMPLVALARYAANYGTGIVLLEGTPLDHDLEVLRAALPGLVTRRHARGAPKIRQAAVVIVDGQVGINGLVGRDRHLLTSSLERHGDVLVFAAYKDEAEELYKKIHIFDKSVGLLMGDDLASRVPVRSTEEFRCWIAYMRGVLSRAVNLLGMVTVVVDAKSFRPLSSFNPSALTEGEFDRMQAEEHAALILQVIGRLLRGELSKRVAVLILNAPPGLGQALRASDLFGESCSLDPIFVESDSIHQAIDQFDRWLAGEGDDFPAPDPALAPRRKKNCFARQSCEGRAVEMAKAGENWSTIYKRLNLWRLPKNDIDGIRKACGF
jgi:hypothetical protein